MLVCTGMGTGVGGRAQGLGDLHMDRLQGNCKQLRIEITFGDSPTQYYGLPPWMSTA